jgi:phage gpG-like protein
MSALGLTITRNDISPALSRLAATAKNPLPVFRAMGTTFKSITEGTFNTVGAGYRPLPWAAKKDGTPSNLQHSTTMAKSFHLEVSSQHARLSNPAIYAAIHQFGGVIRGNPLLKFRVGEQWISVRQVTMPARPFFPVLDGKLTPAAAEKIGRAGERAIARQAGMT